MIGNFPWICSSCVFAPTTEDLTEMTPKKELHLAYALAGILLVVGALSYAAYSPEPPEQPDRIMYQTVAGKVLFNHKAHFAPEQYGVSCEDCHHHPAAEPSLQACSDCHQVVEEDQGVPDACLECHAIEEIEGTEIIKSSDAAHTQCIGCHTEYEAGPADCSECHVL